VAGGKLVIVGASPDPFAISSLQLILTRKSIVGWPSGTSIDSEDTPQVRGCQRRTRDD